MVIGLDVFKEAFAGFEDQYALIGGAATEVHMEAAGLEFRTTKDLDIVLCIEALTPEFGSALWAFIDAGGYEVQERSEAAREFFRFRKPGNKLYPQMLELFSRRPDAIVVPEGARYTPVPIDGLVESLSAMLLDDAYYGLLREGMTVVEGVSVINPQTLIAFKAYAYNNLVREKALGAQVDSRNIIKHRDDVFKLLQLVGGARTVVLPAQILADLRAFVEAVAADETFDPAARRLTPPDKSELIARLAGAYGL